MSDISDASDMTDTSAPSDMADTADMSVASPVSYVSIQEAAHRLQLSERQVRRYIKRGLLPAVRQQGQVRIAGDAIEHLRAQRAAVEGQAVTPDTLDMDTADMSASVPGVHPPASIAPLLASIQTDLAAAREQIERLARDLGHVEAERDVLRGENGRLQAENERLRAATEQDGEETAQSPAPAVASPDGPKMQESLSGTAGQGSDAGDLWATIAAKAAAVPEAVTQAFEVLEAAQPDDPPRRGLLARLFRRHSP